MEETTAAGALGTDLGRIYKMRSQEEARYRLDLARGYLAEAEEDIERKRWRSCAASAQFSIENSAKAIIACFVPVAITHDPAVQLAKLIETEMMPEEVAAKARDIVPIAVKFGGKEHGLLSYGDAEHFRDPWSLVTQAKASEAIEGARRCLDIAEEIYEHFFG